MIEAAGPEACELLAGLHARAFDKPWSAAEMAKLLDNSAVFALIEREQSPRGFVMAWTAAGDGEILTVAVVPEMRRQGVGAALVSAASAAALVRGAASMHLEVAETNLAARALYAKLGYAEAGRRAAYYAGEGGSVDAIVMRRDLPRPPV
ncbi:MAG TPA: ribosomal protein S18-alanine N-acetyltransferase [Vitreimonas sp.]|uniref:ribosomal protein S18-alanine N-acetyltransferase n=1 Tax=Vitreimonas sp. TaxID=3069702 RepID=UPI002D4C41F1|nr:ribosomal protein S18-alanine N-acetyltransferase [Vitreimonas sp.]HYD89637.1 ribosomal protein S18-alanine N-acetyltransferase [Vitreimonas sp.]